MDFDDVYDLSVEFERKRPAIEQDVQAFKGYYLSLNDKDRKKMREAVEMLCTLKKPTLHSRLDELCFDMKLITPGHQEGDYFQPHVSPALLKRAMEAWDTTQEFIPSGSDISFDELL